MPELPEIEHLKRSLEPVLVGARVRQVRLLRRDVAHSFTCDGSYRRTRRRDLLLGETIESLTRHGKELTINSGTGPLVCVHLGMSGQLWYRPSRLHLQRRDHVHSIWWMDSSTASGRLVFRDPRRFGGLWTFPSTEALHATRWSRLGPDALSIGAQTLRHRLCQTRRPIKAALLDQHIVAGIGNIYADEILFAAQIHPLSISNSVSAADYRTLAHVIHSILRHAIAAGGSTTHDYIDGHGRPGSFAKYHQVYGRPLQPCVRCGRELQSIKVVQRTTIFCPQCQRIFNRPRVPRSSNNRTGVRRATYHMDKIPAKRGASSIRITSPMGNKYSSSYSR